MFYSFYGSCKCVPLHVVYKEMIMRPGSLAHEEMGPMPKHPIYPSSKISPDYSNLAELSLPQPSVVPKTDSD